MDNGHAERMAPYGLGGLAMSRKLEQSRKLRKLFHRDPASVGARGMLKRLDLPKTAQVRYGHPRNTEPPAGLGETQ